MAAPEYKLPIDQAEMQRLDTQHQLWDLMIGDIYPQEITQHFNEALATSSPRPAILDVGCGSGVWAIEMATRFPTAQVVGCDINEQLYLNVPDNFQFIRGDVSRGLPEHVEKMRFDVVHCRCVAQHLSDPQLLIASIAGVLKPGGTLLLADGDWIAFNENKRPLVPFVYNADSDSEQESEHRSFYAGWLHLMGKLTRSRRYQFPEVLVQEIGAFEDIHARSYFSPINWAGIDVERGDEIGKIMDKNMRDFFDNTRELAGQSGVSETMLGLWKEEYTKELDQHRYNIWHYCWARKLYI